MDIRPRERQAEIGKPRESWMTSILLLRIECNHRRKRDLLQAILSSSCNKRTGQPLDNPTHA